MKEGVKLNKKIGLFLAAASLAMTISGCSGSATSGKVASSAPDGRDYERIVVISDLHYPTKTGTDDPELRQYKIDNKQKCLQEINGWDDVDLVAFPGDMVALTGTMDEINTVKAFTDNLNKPKVFTAGNHEIFYRDVFTKKRRRHLRQRKREETAPRELPEGLRPPAQHEGNDGLPPHLPLDR